MARLGLDAELRLQSSHMVPSRLGKDHFPFSPSPSLFPDRKEVSELKSMHRSIQLLAEGKDYLDDFLCSVLPGRQHKHQFGVKV